MIKTGKELAAAAKAVAENYNTLYIKGCFGWPMMQRNKDRAVASYAYNAREDRAAKIQAAQENTFGFDCVCLIKALLWGWEGNPNHVYGGATYVSNGVPDKNADQLMALCNDVSEDFGKINVGEAVWRKGHIGIYIGNGLAVECTPKWNDGVQITEVRNISQKTDLHSRTWTKHGKLPYVAYEENYDLNLPVLQKGMKGERIRSLQMLLMGHGHSCGSQGVDGSFGGNTKAAVVAFQRDCGINEDGIVDKQTMAFLLGGTENE